MLGVHRGAEERGVREEAEEEEAEGEAEAGREDALEPQHELATALHWPRRHKKGGVWRRGPEAGFKRPSLQVWGGIRDISRQLNHHIRSVAATVHCESGRTHAHP